MKKALTIAFVAAVAFTLLAATGTLQRTVATTSQLARNVLVKETPLEWRSMLGIGTNIYTTNIYTGAYVVSETNVITTNHTTVLITNYSSYVSGTNIESATISSNKLDANTWMLATQQVNMASALTNMDVRAWTNNTGIYGNGGGLTNVSAVRITPPSTPFHSMFFTNLGLYEGSSSTGSLAMVFKDVTNLLGSALGPHIVWSGDTINDASIYNWPAHGVGASEFLINGRGSICFAAGLGKEACQYRGYQFGIEGAPRTYVYMQHSGYKDTNTALYTSIPIMFKAEYERNGLEYNSGTATSASDQIYMGMYGEAMGTNGDGSISFMDGFDTRWNYWTNNWTTEPRFRVRASPSLSRGGISWKGSTVVNGYSGLTTNYAMADGNTMSFNNGILVSIYKTPEWFEPEVTNYLGRIQTSTSTTLATNLNVLVKTLKDANVWTNIQCFYPFCGASASNQFNLVSTNYTLTFSGSFSANNATGFQGDGSSGFANTHWTNTSQNASFSFVYIKTDVTNGVLFGSYVSGAGNTLCRHPGNSQLSFAQSTAGTDTASGVTAPTSLGFVRTTLPSAVPVYKDGLEIPAATGSTASGTPNTQPVYIGALNNSGSAAEHSAIKLQAVAFGATSITGEQYKIIHDAVVAFNTALGR